MKIHAVHLQGLLSFAQVRGIRLEELSALLNIPATALANPQAIIEHELLYQLIGELERQLQDDGLGWRIGQFLTLNALGLIYQISLQATTLEEAVYYLENFIHTTLPIIRLDTKLGGQTNVLTLTALSESTHLNRILLECVLVIIARELRMMSTNTLSIKLFSPFVKESYPANFQYGEAYSVEFSGLQLKAAIRKFEEAKLYYLVPEYVKLMQGLQGENCFQSKVKMATLNMAKPQLPKLEEIAETFHLTPRTLQRKLASEKLTYRKLSDELKQQISLLLLRHQSYTIADVSHLLGYSEPAAFVHSFKKWHGQTPSSFRKEMLLTS